MFRIYRAKMKIGLESSSGRKDWLGGSDEGDLKFMEGTYCTSHVEGFGHEVVGEIQRGRAGFVLVRECMAKAKEGC